MANNALRQVNPNEVTYDTESGARITLSPQIIRLYLVNGQANKVTDQEIMMFLKLCQYQGLNPFLREAYLIKYSDKYPASIVVGKEVFTKRAERHPLYRGQEAGIYVVDKDGKVLPERAGTMTIPGERVVGGWARIYREGYERPNFYSVSFDEYAQYTTDYNTQERVLNTNWRTRPATMIRKCALVAALREAFPAEFVGMYDEVEINAIDTDKLPQDDVTPPAGIMEQIPQAEETPQEIPPEPAAKMGARSETEQSACHKCAECGKAITEKIAKYSLPKFGRELCMLHQKN